MFREPPWLAVLLPMDPVALLHEMNPHWHGLPRPVPRFERDMVQCLRPALSSLAGSGGPSRRAIQLVSARQTGKTTAMHQLIRARIADGTDPRTILHYVADDPRALRLGLTLEAVLELTAFESGDLHRKWLVVDEVAADPRWRATIKRLVDLGPRAPAILVADSVAALLPRDDASESGLGRIHSVSMLPLSLAEVERAQRGQAAPPAVPDAHLLGLLADEYLSRGGMPAAWFGPAAEGWPFHAGPALESLYEALRQDADVAVSRDAPRIREVRNPAALALLWALCAAKVSSALDLQNVLKAINLSDKGISAPTLRDYVQLLVDLRLLRRLPCVGTADARARHPDKLVAADCGVAAAYLTRSERNSSEHRGYLAEAAVLRHLAELEAGTESTQLGYLRGTQDKEVDFVVSLPREADPVAVEVKHAEGAPNRRALVGLAERAAAAKIRRALWVSRDPGRSSFEHAGVTVERVPLWRFLRETEATLRGGS